MEIKLNYLNIENFKGIKGLTVNAEGEDLKVYGDNNTGKTTVVDSFIWLLFDKNNQDKSDTNFTIKPQNELGQDINHLETLVEAELLVDGKPLKIKKTRVEKWVTRHRETEKTFDGHTKKHWFNEVPVKAKEYQSKVDDLVKEDIFKMITNPLYFNTRLTWQQRREILLQISGNLTNDEVIASDESLLELEALLNGRTVDEYKLVLADQLKSSKKERDNISPRIDELTLSIPNKDIDYTEIENELHAFKDSLSHTDFQLTNASALTNDLKVKYGELSQLKEQLIEVKAKIKSNTNMNVTELINEKTILQNEKHIIQSSIDNLTIQIEQSKRVLEANATTRTRLLSTYDELKQQNETIRSEKFNPIDVKSECPVCNQGLPEAMMQGKIDGMRNNFEKDVKERLDALQIKIKSNMAEGKSLKENTEKTQASLNEFESNLSIKEKELELKINRLSEIEVELSKPLPEPNYTENKDYNQLIERIEQLQTELDAPVEDKSSELLQRKSEIQSKIDECNKILNGKSELEKKKARIEELKVEESQLSIKIAGLEGNKFLLDKFIVAKVNLLEDSINNQFKHVKFKLFEENVTNEGIKETCIALVNTNGAYVKFEDANSAGQINAGIDIINSLCKFYGVNAPMLIDNRESVTKLADTDSQVISFIVSEQDKELRMEKC